MKNIEVLKICVFLKVINKFNQKCLPGILFIKYPTGVGYILAKQKLSL